MKAESAMIDPVVTIKRLRRIARSLSKNGHAPVTLAAEPAAAMARVTAEAAAWMEAVVRHTFPVGELPDIRIPRNSVQIRREKVIDGVDRGEG